MKAPAIIFASTISLGVLFYFGTALPLWACALAAILIPPIALAVTIIVFYDVDRDRLVLPHRHDTKKEGRRE